MANRRHPYNSDKDIFHLSDVTEQTEFSTRV